MFECTRVKIRMRSDSVTDGHVKFFSHRPKLWILIAREMIADLHVDIEPKRSRQTKGKLEKSSSIY